jgi:hypothetical protein
MNDEPKQYDSPLNEYKDLDIDALSSVLDIWEAYGMDVAMEHFDSLKRDVKCCCLHCL